MPRLSPAASKLLDKALGLLGEHVVVFILERVLAGKDVKQSQIAANKRTARRIIEGR